MPVITFINKWDRPGRDALELCDELSDRIGLAAMPLTWPVGHRRRAARGARPCRRELRSGTSRQRAAAPRADRRLTRSARRRVRRGLAACLRGGGSAARRRRRLRPTRFLAARRPRCFRCGGAAISACASCWTPSSASPPGPRRVSTPGTRTPADAPFSGFVFKVQAGMDPSHRDQVAFAACLLRRFERGMVVTHAATGKPFATKYAQQRVRPRAHHHGRSPTPVTSSVWSTPPRLRVGDTLYAGRRR